MFPLPKNYDKLCFVVEITKNKVFISFIPDHVAGFVM